jgi:hypothetical protein
MSATRRVACPLVAAKSQATPDDCACPDEIRFTSSFEEFSIQKPLGRRGGDISNEFGDRTLKRPARLDPGMSSDGFAVAPSRWAKVAFRDISGFGDRLSSQSSSCPKDAESVAEGLQQRRFCFPMNSGIRRLYSPAPEISSSSPRGYENMKDSSCQ